MQKFFGSGSMLKKTEQSSTQWISMSDLMAGLMMVFLLISIVFMRYVQFEKEKIVEVAVAYQNSQVALYEQLLSEFKSDLELWDAELDSISLEFKFKSPEVLFATGDISLKPKFKSILSDFFPRYLAVIKMFEQDITEIRIEGHTSSVWNDATPLDIAYFNNMELSQGRTRSVLEYVYFLPEMSEDRDFIKKYFSAVGFSSSQIILDGYGNEDEDRSRRVGFKVLTNAERQIRKIISY